MPTPWRTSRTSLSLSSSSWNENSPSLAQVGLLSAVDPDDNPVLSFSLVDGNGPPTMPFSNLRLHSLRALPTLDYETNASTFTIRVRVTDQHGFFLDRILTLALNNVVEDLDGDGVEDHYDNDDDGDGFSDTIEIAYGSDPRNASSVANAAPSSLDLNASSVLENNPQDSVIGSLIASDPDINASLSLSLSAGNGSTHNTLFRIDSSNQLRILSSLDFETDASTYSIRVRATDQYGFSLDQVFAISLTNVVEDLDGDGIEDHYDADDDGDGFSDTDEIVYGSDPRNPTSVANAEPDLLSLTNSSFLEEQSNRNGGWKLAGNRSRRQC